MMKISYILQKIIIFLKEVKIEIKKVNWPTRQETIKYVLIVLIISFIVAFYMGGLDFILSFLLRKFIL